MKVPSKRNPFRRIILHTKVMNAYGVRAGSRFDRHLISVISKYETLTLEALVLASSQPDFNLDTMICSEKKMRDICTLVSTFSELGLTNSGRRISSLMDDFYSTDQHIESGTLMDATDQELDYARSVLKLVNILPHHGGAIQRGMRDLLMSEPDVWEELVVFAAPRSLGLSQIDVEHFKQARIGPTSLQGGVL